MARKKESRKAARNKASRIRKKVEANTASVEDLEYLRHYEATKQPAGRPPGKGPDNDEEAAESEADEAADTEPEETDDTGGDDAPDADASSAPGAGGNPAHGDPAPAPNGIPLGANDPVASATPPVATGPRPRLKVSAPPRTRAHVDQPDDGKGKKADWRSKYKAGAGDAAGMDGREITVTKIADAWRGVLDVMADGITAAGGKPVVDPAQLYPMIVLFVDEVLPAHVELTPKMIVVGGSSALLVQRWMNREKIAEIQKASEERDAHRARTTERRERTERAQDASSAPEPEPEPATDPVPVVEREAALVTVTVAGTIPRVRTPHVSSADLIASDPSAVF